MACGMCLIPGSVVNGRAHPAERRPHLPQFPRTSGMVLLEIQRLSPSRHAPQSSSKRPSHRRIEITKVDANPVPRLGTAMTMVGKAPGTFDRADLHFTIPSSLVRELPGPAA